MAYTASQIPVGIILDSCRVKFVPIFAFLIVGLGTIIMVSTTNYLLASIVQLFLGLACSCAFILIFKVTNDFFPPEKVAIISSIGFACGNLGLASMNPLFAYFSEIYSWKSITLIWGAMGILMAVAGYFLIDEKVLEKRVEQRAEEHGNLYDQIKLIFLSKQFILICAFSMAIYGVVSSFCDAWGVTFIKEIYGVDKVKAASAISVTCLGIMVGSPLAAFLSEKLETYKRIMLVNSVILLGLFLLIIFVKLNLVFLNIVLFCIGIVMMGQFLSFPAGLAFAPKKLGATVTGVINTITMSGSVILISVIGFVMDFSKTHWGNLHSYSIQDYKNSMLVIPASIIIAILILFFIKDEYHRRKSQ